MQVRRIHGLVRDRRHILTSCLQRAPQVDEDNMLRMEPLGLDRRHNRYWRFTSHKATTPPDPNVGRIFVERAADGSWLLMAQPEQLDALKAVGGWGQLGGHEYSFEGLPRKFGPYSRQSAERIGPTSK